MEPLFKEPLVKEPLVMESLVKKSLVKDLAARPNVFRGSLITTVRAFFQQTSLVLMININIC